MLMILARLVRSESFWAVVKVRSPHNRPEVWYPRLTAYFWSVFGAKNAKFSSRGSAPHPAGAASPRPQAGAPPQTPS